MKRQIFIFIMNWGCRKKNNKDTTQPTFIIGWLLNCPGYFPDRSSERILSTVKIITNMLRTSLIGLKLANNFFVLWFSILNSLDWIWKKFYHTRISINKTGSVWHVLVQESKSYLINNVVQYVQTLYTYIYIERSACKDANLFFNQTYFLSLHPFLPFN